MRRQVLPEAERASPRAYRTFAKVAPRAGDQEHAGYVCISCIQGPPHPRVRGDFGPEVFRQGRLRRRVRSETRRLDSRRHQGAVDRR